MNIFKEVTSCDQKQAAKRKSSKYDQFGFLWDEADMYHQEEETTANITPEQIADLLSKWDHYKLVGDEKIFGLLFHAIPHQARGEVWKKMVGAEEAQHRSQEEPLAECLDQIMLDINRTFVTNKLFMKVAGQNELLKVLQAYSVYDPQVGYCQGMSYLAGVLLMHMDTESAFWSLVALLEKGQRTFYQPGMKGLLEAAQRFDRVLWTANPVLFKHFFRHNVQTILFLTPWFLTLFTHLSNWSVVLRIWDFVMSDGHQALFRFALAMLRELESDVLHMEGMENIVPALLRIPGFKVHSDQVARSAMSLPIEDFLSRAEEPHTAVEMEAWKSAYLRGEIEANSPILEASTPKIRKQPKRKEMDTPAPDRTPKRSLWEAIVCLATPKGKVADENQILSPNIKSSPVREVPIPVEKVVFTRPRTSPKRSPLRVQQSPRARNSPASPRLSPIIVEILSKSPEIKQSCLDVLLTPQEKRSMKRLVGEPVDCGLLSHEEQSALRFFSTPVMERKRKITKGELVPLTPLSRKKRDDTITFDTFPEL